MSAKLRIFGIVFIFLFLSNTPLWAESSPAPRVWSIEAAQRTELSASISYTVTFSEPVSGVTMDDFAIAGDTMHVTIVAVNAVDGGEEYTIHITVDGDNQGFALALFDDDSIKNSAQIPLGGIGKQNGNAIGNRVYPVGRAPKTTHSQALVGRDVANSIGKYVSLAITSTGLPVMSYIDEATKQLKLAVCLDSACNEIRRTTPVASGIHVRDTSLALTDTDIPVIAYYDVSTNDLKFLRCNTLSCNTPAIVTIDSAGDVGADVTMVLDNDGIAYMAYSDSTKNNMKLAKCNDVACSAPTLTVIDNMTIGKTIRIALSPQKYPVFVYEDPYTDILKIGYCNASSCATNIASGLSDEGVTIIGVAFSSTGLPVIAYQDHQMESILIFECTSIVCSSVTSSSMISTPGWKASAGIFALTETNIPVMSYYNELSKTLQVVSCESFSCTSPILDVIDTSMSVGHMLDLKLGVAGVPIVAYVNPADGKLKIYRKARIIDEGKPNSFAKTAPPAGASLASTEVILAWDAVDNADSYAYCVAVDGVICTSWISTGTARTASLTGLLNKTTYHWQVRATNTIGTTIADAGVEHSFTVSLPPGEFTKTSPAQNAVNQKTSVTLSWGASSYATTYEYCIAATAAACKTWKSTGTARSVVVTGLAKNKIFYWNVRARNEISATNASGTAWKFTTAK